MSTAVSEMQQRERETDPVGTINVFDPHPLNWLFITWNTMEETDPYGSRGLHHDGAR